MMNEAAVNFGQSTWQGTYSKDLIKHAPRRHHDLDRQCTVEATIRFSPTSFISAPLPFLSKLAIPIAPRAPRCEAAQQITRAESW